MKVLFILKLPPPYGGGEIMHEILHNYFSNKKHVFFIILRNKNRNKTNQSKLSLWKFYETFWLYAKFLLEIAKRKPDVIVFSSGKDLVHFLRDSFLVHISKLFNIKVISELHGSRFSFLDNADGLLRRFAIMTLNKIDLIRVLSSSSKLYLDAIGFKRSMVLENGIDIPANSKISDKIQNFVFVGTHSRKKGFDILIDAFISELAFTNNIHLNCVGEWESMKFKEQIKNRISDYKNNIHFHGICIDQDKWAIFDKSDVLMLPSLDEGQPIVILEALAYGLFIIASNVGGIPDTIEHSSNGFLVNPGNVQELKNAIRESVTMCPDKILQIRTKNRQLYHTRYTSEIFTKNFENLLLQCNN